MEQEERKRISFMLAGGDEIILRYEMLIESYKLAVDTLDKRIRKLEEENEELRRIARRWLQ